VTVTPGLHFKVSRRIREGFENGRHYYALDGRQIELPGRIEQCPDPVSLAWHNERCFRE
jgi:putative restriction endonuclease